MSCQLFNRVCFNPKWIFIFLGISWAHLIGYLYSSYLILWLNSFVVTGQIESDKDVETLYSRMTLVIAPTSIFMILITGYMADYVKPIFLIAPGFLGRSITTYCFRHVSEPKGIASFTLTGLLVAFSILEVVSLETLLMKNLPREARGALTILVTFFMGLAGLLFNFIGGPIFDELGPASPFLLISVFDMFIFVFGIFLHNTGYLTTEAEDNENQKDKQSNIVL